MRVKQERVGARLSADQALDTPGLPAVAARESDRKPDHGTVGPAQDVAFRAAPVPRPCLELDAFEQLGVEVKQLLEGELADACRQIKRGIVNNARAMNTKGRWGNLIFVTSAVPNEGKTFNAVNLALSVAMEQDHRALLVDADVVRPIISEATGLSESAGWVEALIDGKSSVEEFTYHTALETLDFLPAGGPYGRMAELLSSENAKSFFDRLASQNENRIIILDGPPLLAASEAAALAEIADQVLVVVERGRTPRSVVQEALQRVANCKHVGLILNRAAQSQGKHYYKRNPRGQ